MRNEKKNGKMSWNIICLPEIKEYEYRNRQRGQRNSVSPFVDQIYLISQLEKTHTHTNMHIITIMSKINNAHNSSALQIIKNIRRCMGCFTPFSNYKVDKAGIYYVLPMYGKMFSVTCIGLFRFFQ